MGQYVIVEPCVVAGRHYVRPTVEEFDDDLAAPLVEAGSLKPYRAADTFLEGAQKAIENAGLGEFVEPAEIPVEFDDEPPTDPPPPRRSRGKRSGS